MTDLKRQYERLEAEMKKLKTEIEKQEKRKSKWEIGEGDTYYRINDAGNVSRDNNNSYIDRYRISIASAYKDRATMERIVKTQNLMRELEKFRDENESIAVDWNDGNQCKYYIYYSYDDRRLTISEAISSRDFGNVYFATVECAKAAIEKFGDRIKEVMA